MKGDCNGCSTCPAGKEQYEAYLSALKGRERIQYDYRHPNGTLFSCVADTLDSARRKRDLWFAKRNIEVTN